MDLVGRLRRRGRKILGNRRVARTLDALRGNRCPTGQVRALFARFQPFDTGFPLIRVGGDHDGGYLLPDDLDGIAAGFSPGVDVMVTFDSEMAARGIPMFLADASVSGIAVPHPLLTFERLYVGAQTRGDTISMQDWIARHAPTEGDLLLQMDIEGAEYDTLLAMRDADLARFRVVALELHGLDDAFTVEGHARIGALMDKLLAQFVICHLHPNNYYPLASERGIAFPRLLELSLLRRDRTRHTPVPVDALPHPLDMANVPDKPDWICPPFWKG